MENISIGDLIVLGVCAVVVLFGVPLLAMFAHHAPSLFQRYIMARQDRLMSRSGDVDDPEEMLRTSMPVPVQEVVRPDTTAVNTGTPQRTSTTRQSDAELVAYLAMARTPDGKERFSANAIAVIMGGTRSEVLDQVRAIRKLPMYPLRTSEQEMVRKNLELV